MGGSGTLITKEVSCGGCGGTLIPGLTHAPSLRPAAAASPTQCGSNFGMYVEGQALMCGLLYSTKTSAIATTVGTIMCPFHPVLPAELRW